MNEEQPIFKVTDRRLFNADGTPRDVERAEVAETKEAKTGEPRIEASPTKEQPSPSTEERATVSRPDESKPGAAQRTPAASPAQPDRGENRGTGASEASARALHAEAPEQFSEEDYSEKDVPGADDPASFINFLMSIASNAAAALGMMEHPATGQRTVDTELAKHWIDVLGMLQQKTRGNLAPQEQQIYEGLLADLRMQYVSLSGASQPKTPLAFTGSDITGGR